MSFWALRCGWHANLRNQTASHITSLGSNPAAIRSFGMIVPADGRVIVNVSGYFTLKSTGQDLARCSINVDSDVVDPVFNFQVDDFGTPLSQAFIPMAATRGFSVSPGPFTVRLVCQEMAGSVEIRNSSLTVLFVATPNR